MSQTATTPNLNDIEIPETYEFRGYEYDLWKATTEEGFARIEAAGVRGGAYRRMYGITKACVKKWDIDGVTVWCVYTRCGMC